MSKNETERRQLILPSVIDYKIRLIAAHRKIRANEIIVQACQEWLDNHPEQFEQVPIAVMEASK